MVQKQPHHERHIPEKSLPSGNNTLSASSGKNFHWAVVKLDLHKDPGKIIARYDFDTDRGGVGMYGKHVLAWSEGKTVRLGPDGLKVTAELNGVPASSRSAPHEVDIMDDEELLMVDYSQREKYRVGCASAATGKCDFVEMPKGHRFVCASHSRNLAVFQGADDLLEIWKLEYGRSRIVFSMEIMKSRTGHAEFGFGGDLLLYDGRNYSIVRYDPWAN